MTFLSLEPFVPSGSNFEGSKQLFQELGFTIAWEAGGMVGFVNGNCKFILQHYDVAGFPENFMLSVRVSSAADFWQEVTTKKLPERFGIRISKPTKQPYGIEVNLIDIAGVCWHFIE